jgi:branched-chain amino acid aminotransferase
MDGNLVPWAEANVHVTAFGLQYGLGFFEGIRCYRTERGTVAFRLTDHLRRLERSAAVYGVALPYSVEELRRACAEVVIANELADCYLRPIVFLGGDPNPFAGRLHAAVIPNEQGPLAGLPNGQGVGAQISSFHRMSPNSLPPTSKATGQYLNAFLAQQEALRSGYQEAILLNADGYVADGWVHNVFIIKDGVLATPPTSSGALAGITRDSIMTLARARGLPVQMLNMVRSDLYLADECFLSGTASGIVPVTSVDGRQVGSGKPGELTGALAEDLRAAIGGTAYPQWVEAIR